jgi:hypothetical protein
MARAASESQISRIETYLHVGGDWNTGSFAVGRTKSDETSVLDIDSG